MIFFSSGDAPGAAVAVSLHSINRACQRHKSRLGQLSPLHSSPLCRAAVEERLPPKQEVHIANMCGGFFYPALARFAVFARRRRTPAHQPHGRRRSRLTGGARRCRRTSSNDGARGTNTGARRRAPRPATDNAAARSRRGARGARRARRAAARTRRHAHQARTAAAAPRQRAPGKDGRRQPPPSPRSSCGWGHVRRVADEPQLVMTG